MKLFLSTTQRLQSKQKSKFKSQKHICFTMKTTYTTGNGEMGYVRTFEKRGGQAWWAVKGQRIPRIHIRFSFTMLKLYWQ